MLASILYWLQKSVVNHFCKFIFYEYICEYTYAATDVCVDFLSKKLSKQQKSEKSSQKSTKNVRFCRYNNIYILL